MSLRTCLATIFIIPILCASLHAQTPPYLWSQRFGNTFKDGGYGVAVDAMGNVVVTGEFRGTVDLGGGILVSAGGSDIFVAKYAASGEHQWSQRFGSLSDDSGYGVAVDASGNVVVTGVFQCAVDFGGGNVVSGGAYDIFVAKYDASGAHQWSQGFGSTVGDYGWRVAVDASGNVVVTGGFQSTVNFGGGNLVSGGAYDIFVAKFDASGAHQWSQRGGSTVEGIATDVAVDPSGNVVVTGTFQGTVDFGGGNLVSAGEEDIFVAKYNASGAHQWSRRFGSTIGDWGGGVAVDASGNVVVTGGFQGTVDFGGGNLSAGGLDVYVAKYAASGAHQWSQNFGSTNANYGHDLAVDASGNVVVTGEFQATVDFGGGNLVSAGGYDIFVAKYDASGAHQWSQRAGSTVEDYGADVAVDASGNVLVTGIFQGTADFGGGPLTSAGNYDIFLVKYSCDPCAVPEGPQTHSHLLGAYPNPFNPNTSVFFTIDQTLEVYIEIFDVMGRSISVVADQIYEPGEHSVRWDGRNLAGNMVSSGTYFVRMKYADGVQSQKIMLVK